jgi:lipid-A-disaccharide synthase-like uncharacterized protein
MDFSILGFIGTAIITLGYLPQIIHLVRERCAWGISLSSWRLWLLGGVLLFLYSLARRDVVFATVQAVQIIAMGLTIYYASRSTHVCPHHLAAAHAGLARDSRDAED